MFVIGRPDYAPVIGRVQGIAAQAGLQVGDAIEKIGDYDLIWMGWKSWDDDLGQTAVLLAELLDLPHVMATITVLERDGDWLVVNAVPLVLREGRLEYGASRPERIQAWRDGASFIAGVGIGDIVSVHWSFACDRLAPRQLAGLIRWTTRELAVANETL